jgi:Protoglobin
MTDPHGYNYASAGLATSPVTLGDLELLKTTLLWSDSDTAALRRAGEILAPQVEAVLDVWYGFVGGNAHLVATFAGSDGVPDGTYLGAVRARFARWIVDLCTQEHDQTWLDWQYEIAIRHHHTKKNITDDVSSTSAEIPMRYLIAFVVPITLTITSFLASGAADDAELAAMQAAWFKAVTLTVTLWSQPYSSLSW